VSRSGHDPADNRVNNGINRWAADHPVGVTVVILVLAALGLVFLTLRRLG
jgi:hypothetical protein